ncbi:hypothetical protein B0H11DRAFT_1911412 [Mycena galericulata]|nr:hypothetical protein B0H11DRAFT_1911412 [Mycena galericulata]
MSRYLDGDDARENPLLLQALQREGSDGGEHGSGAFDLMSQTEPIVATSDSIGHSRQRFRLEGGKKIANATSESNVEQVPRVSDFFQFPNLLLIARTPSIRLSVSQLRVTAPRNHQSTIVKTSTMMCSVRKRVKRCERATKPADRDTAPSPAKRKSVLTAAAPAPKPKRRKTGDSLAGRPIELVPGDKMTAVSPREYAQKD